MNGTSQNYIVHRSVNSRACSILVRIQKAKETERPTKIQKLLLERN